MNAYEDHAAEHITAEEGTFATSFAQRFRRSAPPVEQREYKAPANLWHKLPQPKPKSHSILPAWWFKGKQKQQEQQRQQQQRYMQNAADRRSEQQEEKRSGFFQSLGFGGF